MAQVSFDGVTIALDDVQNNPVRYARLLERAKKSPGHALRRCRPDDTGKFLRLVFRRYGALFHLAREPEEGPHHDAQLCPLYASAAAAGKKKSDASDAIQRTPSGLNVKLDASLSVRTVNPRLACPRTIRAPAGRAGPRRCSASCNAFGSRRICISGWVPLHAVGVNATLNSWPHWEKAISTVSQCRASCTSCVAMKRTKCNLSLRSSMTFSVVSRRRPRCLSAAWCLASCAP